jgi:hypothetical protein
MTALIYMTLLELTIVGIRKKPQNTFPSVSSYGGFNHETWYNGTMNNRDD